MIALWLAVSAPAHAQCAERAWADEVTAAVARVEAAWTALDPAKLAAAAAEVEARVACLDDALRPSDVAGVMRARALAHFVARDRDGAIGYFAAARAANPSYELPATLAAATHPLRAAWEDARAVPPDTAPLPAPAEGWITIDGIRGLAAPTARPWLFQRFDAQGKVVETAIVATGAIGPSYPVAATVAVEAPEPAAEAAPTFALLAGGMVYTRHPQGSALGTLSPSIAVPAGPVDVDIAAVVGLGPAGDGAVLVPMLRVGALARLGDGASYGRVGAVVTATSHDDAALVPGVSVAGGVRARSLLVDVHAGWNGGFTAGLAAGVVLDL